LGQRSPSTAAINSLVEAAPLISSMTAALINSKNSTAAASRNAPAAATMMAASATSSNKGQVEAIAGSGDAAMRTFDDGSSSGDPSPSRREPWTCIGTLKKSPVDRAQLNHSIMCDMGNILLFPAPFHRQPHKHSQFVRSVLHELILEGRIEIGQARARRIAGLTDLRPGIADGHTEVLGDPL